MQNSEIDITNYLKENTPNMISEWLDSIYSMEKPYTSFVYAPLYKDELRADSKQTASLIIDFFSSDKDQFESSLTNWLNHMYKRRMENEVPLPEVLMTLDKLRHQFLKWSGKFAIQTDSFTKNDYYEVVHAINFAFDIINEKFTDLYFTQIMHHLSAQQSMIEEISTPIISITDHIAILPLIGHVDDDRAKHLMETATSRCSQLNIDYLCIDLSAITTFETTLVEMLFSLADILKLLGIELVLSGITPKMAQQMVLLDADIEIPAYHSLKEVLHEKV
ncbi:STAS domain-containing protein [Listeria fleischmannii]|uniref:STAS domain-containing protein n=1 Tax=Listeria fleischmannii TaxID=1069827 RepID=UPI001628558F|nr:STAS domain-containing protein [Listeria fleischmannii]MBC1419988.1 STAS domain-containing protein [Listeria fleischmannii]